MSIVRAERVENKGGSSIPFWPKGGKRLVVVFEKSDDGGDRSDTCVARGLDPDRGQAVFSATLALGQQDAFLEAVREGRAGQLLKGDGPEAVSDGRAGVRNENAAVGSQHATSIAVAPAQQPEGDVVVVSDPGPGNGPGPKYTVSLSGLAPGEAKRKVAAGS